MKIDDALSLARQRIADLGFDTVIRKAGSNAFVYSKADGRAIEISRDHTGYFIELFEGSEESSVRDYLQDNIEHSIEQAVSWLQRRESNF